MAGCISDYNDGNTHRGSCYNRIQLLLALVLVQLCDCCQANNGCHVFLQFHCMSIHLILTHTFLSNVIAVSYMVFF
jgi:hypothetical protein